MKNITIFRKIINNLLDYCKDIIQNCKEDKMSRKFFLMDFIEALIFYYLNDIESLRLLETELEDNKLGITESKFSTMKDAFHRFDYRTFKHMFEVILESSYFLEIEEFKKLGKLCLVDGSIFNLSIRADWAEHRKNKRGIKLHLAWNLNQMVVESLEITDAKGNEREYLEQIIQKDITYIADRGYTSFDLYNTIVENNSHFIIRIKKNAKYNVVTYSEDKLESYGEVQDLLITFSNDPYKRCYRLIKFKVFGEVYYILTDRLDLTIEEIIMLFACRWQIELVFRYLKCTINGKHILNESKNGLYIQFYMIAIIELLKLSLKQQCLFLVGEKMPSFRLSELLNNAVSNVGNELKNFWKISKHWLALLRKFLNCEFTFKIARKLALCK